MSADFSKMLARDSKEVLQSISGNDGGIVEPAAIGAIVSEQDTPFVPPAHVDLQLSDGKFINRQVVPIPGVEKRGIEETARRAEVAFLPQTSADTDPGRSDGSVRRGVRLARRGVAALDVEKGIWKQEVVDVLKYFADHSCKLRPDSRQITVTGSDGSGKTTLVKLLATHMKKLGLPVTVMRGSGVTGTEDLLAWVERYKDSNSDGSEIIADLRQVMAAQAQYSAESDPRRKVAQGVSMQKMMFDLVQKYLDRGYYVVSDRGVLDAFLGARERVGSADELTQVAKVFSRLPFGPSVRVRVSPVTAMVRLMGKQEMPPLAELVRRQYEFDYALAWAYRVFGRKLPGVTPGWFMTVNGEAEPREVLRAAVDILAKNGFLLPEK